MPTPRFSPLRLLGAACLLAALAACAREPGPAATATATTSAPQSPADYAAAHAHDYATVPLRADLSRFDARGRRMIALLIQACDVTNEIFWRQSWNGDRAELLARAPNAAARTLIEINYGPWDRLNEDAPMLPDVGPRPPGAAFYPVDMSKEEFEASPLPDKTSPYTLLRREAGRLVTVPYREAYRPQLERAAALLREAAGFSDDAAFAAYLRMRADALLSDDYRASDLAWMDMKTNPVDVVIGPIEVYDDRLYGYKAAYEGLVLIKDQAWSEKLARFAEFLPALQQGLPVPAKYKAERPGANADLNAYRAVFYAGDANAGAKTIAINLPNDEDVQLRKGTRRLQLENVMQAKFDAILMPIAQRLIARDQLRHVTFDAFFANTMFHEVAHGLGIKKTVDGRGTVDEALKEYASSLEEGKADVLGLYMIDALSAQGELDKAKLMDHYVTFLAGILRSVRFGASDAHGKANMLRFNYFARRGAFVRDADGRYRVDLGKMRSAARELGAKLLTVQGDGDYEEARRMSESLGAVPASLAADLATLKAAKIPIDLRFEQGLATLGLGEYAAERR
ncbi:dipeptidyl-peptidase 3 family protein [Vulcaniibacterium tengchongense]|uniref:Peptidase M49-like protein n=1 Tax=Vulcaniibacterium tengchongense TaxID=1273429 RepID=A0A3N4VDB9_9GAMM|nr:Zn-dependent hydrolase [Vulcaniibacterium tengchongense]RPE81002.1 peptidase M49-like protein [Vulcaniibacterium tengchongense]